MGDKMDAIQCLKKRRSVRSFEDKKIDKQTLKDIIDCARLAPSARNEQKWEFAVITDESKLKKIASMTSQGFIEDSSACVVVLNEDYKYYLEDGSAATENILLAARAYGLGSCWVAGDKKPYAEDMLKFLNVPEKYNLISIIPLGYGQFPEPHGKRKLEDVLHWQGF